MRPPHDHQLSPPPPHDPLGALYGTLTNVALSIYLESVVSSLLVIDQHVAFVRLVWLDWLTLKDG